MLGFKNFFSPKRTIAGIESIRMIQKGQIDGFDVKKINLSEFQTPNGLVRLKTGSIAYLRSIFK
jgi:hypothetical protein